jgi:hypothetical protein
LQWECKVMVFWCIPASLAMDRDCNGTWLKVESPL